MKASLIIIALIASAASAQVVKIAHKPAKPLIEIVDGRSYANFDLLVSNSSADTITLTKIVVKMYDANNLLLKEKFIDNNGTAPSIATIGKREATFGHTLNVFNPFAEIPAKASRLVFTFTFDDGINVSHTVYPVAYEQKVEFMLPVKGAAMVYDGHDAMAHHRRFDYEFGPIKNMGFSSNFMRYAYDFVTVDTYGKQFRTNGAADSDWYSFGADIVAVADGTVVSLETAKADDKTFDVSRLSANQMELFGNYVVIKHDNELFSVYGHMKQNSSSLKVGDKVVKGQKIGAIGTSGSSFMPHLHFEVRNSSGANAEGLPSYFSDFTILLGNEKQKVAKGTVNTGDIFTSN